MSTNQNNKLRHFYFMNLALMQAERVIGNTKRNPAVGCVIVKNDFVLSAAHTSLNGRPHAETNAINFSKSKIKNSILYVTLEPCSHFGLTPPCTNKIISRKIGRVYFSIKDPDIRSYNKSSKILKKKGVFANEGILSTKIKKFYKSYFKFKNKNLPYVTCKMAMSKDYYTVNKQNKWITNKFSRGRVHLMRSKHDAILTSVKTVIKDNPKLTCRINGLENTSPLRVILDKDLKIPIKSEIVKTAYKYKTIIFFNNFIKRKIKKLKRLKVKLIKIPLNHDNNFDLKYILKIIAQLGFSRVFLETGIKLTSNFLKANLINEVLIFSSSRKLGTNGSNSFKKKINNF